MDPITQQAVLATAGAAGGDKVYVDDVFSTFLYDGNDSTNQIINDIDLAGEGGLVWLKPRTATLGHTLYDTERGAGNYLKSELTAANYNLNTYFSGYGLTSFNNNGFTLGANWTGENATTNPRAVSWTFRKAPGFFDVVTYTGNSSSRTIAHNLGSVPGMIIVKSRTQNEGWKVWHRSLTDNQKFLNLHEAGTPETSSTMWNNTAPTSTHFSLGINYSTNNNGETYVAYVFAHDDASFGTGGNESIIKCGSYTGNGSATGPTINLGFEPQWLIIKPSQNSGGWMIFDNMRGVVTGGTDKRLEADAVGGDITADTVDFNSTGFTLTSTSSNSNTSGNTYIYMVIRRPHKPPTAGTEVFAAATQTGRSGNQGAFRSGFAVDMAIRRGSLNGTADNTLSSRLQQGKYLTTNSNGNGSNDSDNQFDYMDGWNQEGSSATYKFSWMFKRAPGFFDIVTYTGNNIVRNITHGLGVAPEFMLVKNRTVGYQWCGYSTVSGAGKSMKLSADVAPFTPGFWNNTAPTSSVFTVNANDDANGNGHNFVAYLFATLPGISKVGSYNGVDNTTVTVDCGFTGGPRFLLIKRTDSTGGWQIWDSTRGINSGTNSYDPYHFLNSFAAQSVYGDYIDPTTSGFTIKPAATGAGLNTTGGTYFFLAIA